MTPEEHRQLAEWPDGPRLFEHLRDLPAPLRLRDARAYVRSLGFSSDLIVRNASSVAHRRVVDDPVDDRGGGGRVEKDLGPACEQQIRRHHETAALVALADEAEQQACTDLVEWNVSQLIEKC